MSFDFREFKKFQKDIERFNKEWDNFIKKFLLEMGLRALADVKRNTSTITGLLKNSWQIGGVTRKGDKIEIVLYNHANYSSYYEYGHMTRNREGFVQGKFTCSKAIKRIEEQIPSRFKKAFETWINSL